MPDYKLPYDGSPPMPGTGVNFAVGVMLIDPTSGLPITPAGSAPAAAGPGISNRAAVGTAGTELVVAAAVYKSWVTVQNTHASQTLYLSFASPALATDFAVAPGAALTLPLPFVGALYGRGSGAGTTFATIGV